MQYKKVLPGRDGGYSPVRQPIPQGSNHEIRSPGSPLSFPPRPRSCKSGRSWWEKGKQRRTRPRTTAEEFTQAARKQRR